MLKSRLLHIITLLTALFVAVGCGVDSDNGATTPSSGKYGTLQLGKEYIPINFVQVSDMGDVLLVILSPKDQASELTTNAIIGVKKELLGTAVDVEHKYCNDDYFCVYEDPQCYYAPFRPLQSGEIVMRQSGTSVGVEVDVILYDGTPLRYSHDSLQME